MNLPNGLTLGRIFLVPLLVVVLSTRLPMTHPHEMLIATVIFLAASLTDLLDGYFARKRGQVTTLGVLLDPIADKLLISAAVISLVEIGMVPAWMAAIIIGREFAVSGLRSIASSEGFTIGASDLGKIKMVAQVVAITLLMLGAQYPQTLLPVLGRFGLYVVVVFALWSAVGYFTTFWTKIDDRFKAQQERRRLILLKRRQRRYGHAPTP